jgi:hypothetical protein
MSLECRNCQCIRVVVYVLPGAGERGLRSRWRFDGDHVPSFAELGNSKFSVSVFDNCKVVIDRCERHNSFDRRSF